MLNIIWSKHGLEWVNMFYAIVLTFFRHLFFDDVIVWNENHQNGTNDLWNGTWDINTRLLISNC